MRQIIEKNDKKEKIFSDRAIVVNGHCNEFHKKVMLIELLTLLKKKFKDAHIFYATHLPIDKEIYDYVDYIVYNKNNPIFNKEIITKFSRDVWWWNTWTYRGEYNLRLMRNMLYHGYAHHMLLNDATALANNQRMKYIHYVNYDVRLDIIDSLEDHYNYMKNDDYELVAYQYYEDGIGTEFFSAKTDAAMECISSVLSLDDYEKFGCHSLEQQYERMFKHKKIKNLGYFKENEYYVGRLRFDFRDKTDTVIPLNSNIDGILIIPYHYEDDIKICVSNSNSKLCNVEFYQYNSEHEQVYYEMIPLHASQWIEFVPRPNTKYIKAFFDGLEKTYFDLDDKFNYGHYVKF